MKNFVREDRAFSLEVYREGNLSMVVFHQENDISQLGPDHSKSEKL